MTSFITGTFSMEVPDDMHGEDIEGILNEIEEGYKLRVTEWK